MNNIPATYRKIHVVNTKTLAFSEQTEIFEVPMQHPSSGEVLVKVLFAGIEASDILQNSGQYGPLADYPLESNLDGSVQVGDCGCESVGTVVAVGEGVEIAVGTSVIVAGFGVGFREYITCPAAQVIPLPVPATAAMTAIPVSATTAAAALDISGQLKKGERVLVTGAAGGTGQFAVQWAKVKHDAYVVGVCGSEEKAAMLRDIGCDDIINYKQESDLSAAIKNKFPEGIDVVYEGIGGSLRDAAWENMAVFGRMVCIGSVADYGKENGMMSHKIASNSVVFRSASLTGFYLFHLMNDPRFAEVVGDILRYISAGKISVHVDPLSKNFFGLNGVYQAQQHIRSGLNVGKVYATIGNA